MLLTDNGVKTAIRRSFQGTPDELVNELLQNARRAHATEVQIELTPEQLIIRDNGHGLNTEDDYLTLLTVGKTGFKNIADEEPYGLGFHATLANAGIKALCVQSGGYSFSINTDTYWENFDEHVLKQHLQSSPSVPGTTITLECDPTLLAKITEYFKESEFSPTRICGYKDFLTITFNGKPLRTWSFTPRDPIQTTFEANRLIISQQCDTHAMTYINWFGQLISIRRPYAHHRYGLDLMLTVTQGTPLTLTAPVRDAIVEDVKFTTFQKHIEDALFAAFAQTPTLELFNLCVTNYPERSQTLEYTKVYDAQDHFSPIGETSDLPGQSVVLIRKDTDTIILGDLDLDFPESQNDFRDRVEYWANHLIPEIQQLTNKAVYLAHSVTPKNLVWKATWTPGTVHHEYDGLTLCNPGTLMLTQHQESYTFDPLTMLVIVDSHGLDPSEANWFIGHPDPLGSLTTYGYAAFNSEDDYSDIETYRQELNKILRQLRGNAIDNSIIDSLNDVVREQVKTKIHNLQFKRLEALGDDRYKLVAIVNEQELTFELTSM